MEAADKKVEEVEPTGATCLYHHADGRSKVFEGDNVEIALDEGWVDHPPAIGDQDGDDDEGDDGDYIELSDLEAMTGDQLKGLIVKYDLKVKKTDKVDIIRANVIEALSKNET